MGACAYMRGYGTVSGGGMSLLEMVAVLDESDRWHVFHAMRATPKVLRELKLL